MRRWRSTPQEPDEVIRCFVTNHWGGGVGFIQCAVLYGALCTYSTVSYKPPAVCKNGIQSRGVHNDEMRRGETKQIRQSPELNECKRTIR